jgi:GGDEF domain-containing protein
MSQIQRDPATGLIAYDDFLKLLKYEAERLASTSGLVVACIDLDQFLAHREIAGEESAARTLERFASHLREHLGLEVALGFEPADGFWFIFPAIPPERALLSLEDLRRNLAAADFPLTFSAGLSICPRDGKTEGALVRHARMALVRAKWAGRNQLALASRQRMVLKSNYYPRDQLECLQRLARARDVAESELLREALDLLFVRHEAELRRIEVEGSSPGPRNAGDGSRR